MEAMRFLPEAACILAFAASSLLVPLGIEHARMAKMTSRAKDSALMGDGLLARLLRNGIKPVIPMVRWLMRWRRIRRYFQGLAWLVHTRGIEAAEDKVGSIVVAVSSALLLAGALLSGSVLFGLMASACLALGCGFAAKQARERQREAMREEVPDMLHAMSACFHAGYSLLQTFHHVALESHGPLGCLFERAESDLRTGCTAAEALQHMREKSSLSELAFVTAALEIQHQTGGSLQKIIDSACDSVEGELALRRSLRVQTAQARLSMRVVTVMPFVLIAVFSLVSPGFLSPFFASPLGFAVFGLAMGMQAAGIFSVRRMLDMKEE